ncbi:MAG: RDD family protein [Chitinophagaceae bacterium]|nr:RDD family protein [Chitinophagaceae bacterium]
MNFSGLFVLYAGQTGDSLFHCILIYFTISENSRGPAIAKQKLALRVVAKNGEKATFTQLLVRNCIKFLP